MDGDGAASRANRGDGGTSLGGRPGARIIRDAGDGALRVILGEGLDVRVNEAVLGIAAAVRRQAPAGVLSVISGYTSVLIEYDPAIIGRDPLFEWLAGLEPEAAEEKGRVVTVPVSYGGEHGPDLEDVAARLGLAPDEVVAIHTHPVYRVYATGFAPGFPFAAPLDDRLQLARRDSPRERVPAGSVAIAGRQTGIYPLPTPGGWHILGRTPLPLFSPEAAEPVLIRPGDSLRFVAVSVSQYADLALGTDSG